MDRKELVKQAVLSVTEKDVKKYGNQSCAVTIRASDKCKPKQLENAVAEYAAGCRPEDIAVLVDQTILGNGKKGFLFATDGFYASRNILAEGPLGKPCIPYPVVYDEIDSVEVDPKEPRPDYLIINYKSGYKKRAYGCIDNCYIVAVLNAIVRALEEEKQTEASVPEEAVQPEVSASEEPETMEAPVPEEAVQPEVSALEEPATPEARFAAKKADAEACDAQAQFDLGLMYENGEGTATDLAEALRWYETAAKQGHSKAQNYTGYAYKKGMGTEPDEKKAVSWYKKSAMGGYPQAQRNYALALLKGAGCEADPEEALYWMEQAATNGLDRAQERVAQMYEDGDGCSLPEEARKVKARGWYEKAAEQGRENAQFSCALMYYKGEGGEQDRQKAFSWFLRAAEQGNAAARMNCGIMYMNGDGTERDPEQALAWMKKAAEQGQEGAQELCGKIREMLTAAQEDVFQERQGETQWEELRRQVQEELEQEREAANNGNPEAQYRLAGRYDRGYGALGQDKAEALRWYVKAAGQGHAGAQFRCAMMYRDGEGTEADQMRAVEWCRKCAHQDHAEAQYLLGIMYYGGDRGTQRNTARGLYWITKAKDYGMEDAEELWKKASMQELVRWGEAMSKGGICTKDPLMVDVKKDQIELMHARKKAAGSGDAAAQYWYAAMLSTGEGTDKNEEDALYWYEKAADQGDVCMREMVSGLGL